MSFQTGTQEETLFAGPTAAYTTGGASSTSVFALTAGATGNFQQPLLPGGFFQQGRSGQLVSVKAYLTVSGQASATTLTITLGLATSPNQTSVTGGVLLTFPALTVTNFSSGGIRLSADIICRGAGYGVSSVSTSLATSGEYLAQLSSGSATTLQGVVNLTTLTTVDFSVNQWVTLLGQFSTNSASNTAALNQVIVEGKN